MSGDAGSGLRPYPAEHPLPVGGLRCPYVLTINDGSSRLKLAVYATGSVERVFADSVEPVRQEEARVIVASDGRDEERKVEAPDQAGAAEWVIQQVPNRPGGGAGPGRARAWRLGAKAGRTRKRSVRKM